MKIMATLRKHLAVVSYLVFYFILLAQKLITKPMPFYDWDESIYIQLGVESIQNMSVIQTWQGVTWLDKPPFVPLLYGAVIEWLPFPAEVSVRVTTLIFAVAVLSLLYALYYRVIKEQFLTTLIIIATSITPIFLQRAQVGNIDVFLLLGWTGYILFFNKFWLSLLFLGIAVMSKSLVGFYPVAIMLIYYGYLFYVKNIDKKEFIRVVKKIAIHVGILLSWYVIMFIVYGNDFLVQHVYETHFKRVTDSIESHFGKRTYYIDILFEQFGYYAWISLVGLGVLCWQWYRGKIKIDQFMNGTFLLPWFLFLNLTKTKIFWYGYPYIPQFVFLMFLPLIVIKRFISEKLYYIIVFGLITVVMYQSFNVKKVHADQYASVEDHHKAAIYANNHCENLAYLVESYDREAKETLESMDLTITTTKWWGTHPSMVFYFDGKIDYIYDLNRFNEIIKERNPETCVIVSEEEMSKAESLQLVETFGKIYLYKF